MIAPQWDASRRDELIIMLNCYRDAFAKNIYELGCTDVLKMDIVVAAGSEPVNVRPYRTSLSDRQIITTILDEWKRAGIISDLCSPYASPVLLVSKSTGDKRLCVDYRKLNAQTVAPPYPMSDVDEQLSALAGGTIFTTLDLSNGFLQILLMEEAKEKSAFVIENITAKFERMPFGLKGAAGTFQKLMGIVFKDLKESGVVKTYLDDIIIPSTSWDEMLRDLEKILKVLVKARLTLKPAKCNFGAEQLDYLGYRISKGVIKPGRKVEAIDKFPTPKDAHEVRRFLGLTGYFHRFIVKYAELVEPLTRLTGMDVPFTWDDRQGSAFNELKHLLKSEPIVRMYSSAAAVTELHTDASSRALSGILLQGPSSLNLHMVYAVSKKTTDAESRYHSSWLELYAIIWSINRLRPFLLGIRFVVVTDCQALIYLNIHKSVKPQIARWYEILQEYDFDIKYRPGSRMAHVDALSRATSDDDAPDESVDAVLSQRAYVFVAMSIQYRVRFMQQGDPSIRKRLLQLETVGPKIKQAHKDLEVFQVVAGLLYRK